MTPSDFVEKDHSGFGVGNRLEGTRARIVWDNACGALNTEPGMF